MSLKQLINKYGAPDKVVVLPLIEHKAINRVSLLYLQGGFTAVLPDISQQRIVELLEGTSVQEIIYHSPVLTLEELNRDVFHSPENVVEFYQQHSYDWIGYGPVKIMQP